MVKQASLGRRALDPKSPASFYLPDASLDSLADAVLLVQNSRLPVHSQVLSLHSGVLRGLFVSQMEGRRLRAKEPVSVPLVDCEVKDACLFLRLLYCPQEITGRNLGSIQEELPAVAALAHKLDAAIMLNQIVRHIDKSLRSQAVSALVRWVQLAERLQLADLRLRCLRQLALQLAYKDPYFALTPGAGLGGLGEESLRILLSMLLAAAKRGAVGSSLAALVPSVRVAEEGIERAQRGGAQGRGVKRPFGAAFAAPLGLDTESEEGTSSSEEEDEEEGSSDGSLGHSSSSSEEGTSEDEE